MWKWKQEFILKQRKNKKSIHKKAIKKYISWRKRTTFDLSKEQDEDIFEISHKKVEIGSIILNKNNNNKF